jgi:alpha-tubulin suppressor-like RCC1 family protein
VEYERSADIEIPEADMTNTWTNAVILATTALVLWGCGNGDHLSPDNPVGTVTITPATASTAPGRMVQLQAVTRNAAGAALTDREITWSSGGEAVATVSATGLVTGVAEGSTTITAASEGKAGSAVITVATPATLTFASITARDHTTCGVSTAGAAYCWGLGITGELGDGATAESRRSTPEPVRGGLTFASLSHGNFNSCGITAAGVAYCWGWNLEAELGVGSTTGPETCPLSTGYLAPCATVPVAVTGDLSFTSLSVGGSHSCGITAAGAAYCWGHNFYGQLGLGSTAGPDECPRSDIAEIAPCSTIPVRVSGGLTFTSLSAGGTRTGGVTTSGSAYCWGSGILGDGSTDIAAHPAPVLVAGGLSFASVSAGTYHTCGITTAHAAYC